MSLGCFRIDNYRNCQHQLRAASVGLCLVSIVALAIILSISQSVGFNQITLLSIGLPLGVMAAGALLSVILIKLCAKKVDCLQAIPASIKEKTEQKTHFKWGYIEFCLTHELYHSDYSDNYLGPDDSELSNLFRQYQDPEIAFVSSGKRSCNAFNVSSQSHIEMLIDKLKSEFLEGKKIIFAILSTGKHALAAGFSSDGSFVIVDSMGSNSVDPKNIENILNLAKLKDQVQNEIYFEGYFIHTHIQKGGHECLRFATLYCYHMAVCKDLTAFEEVNGAFLKGRLRCFEDHEKIAGSPRIQSLKNKTCDYRAFMLSWAYRSLGLTIDAWWQLSLNELACLQNHQFEAEMIFCSLSKSCLPKFYDDSQFNLEIISSLFQRKTITVKELDTLMEIPNPDLHAPMEEALFKNNQRYLLVFIKGDPQPHLYQLKRGEKVEYSSLNLGEGKEFIE